MSKRTRDKREAFAVKSALMARSGTPFFNRQGASQFPQRNFISERLYQGVNASYLQDAMIEKGYYCAEWVTFSDANKMSLTVRKGEQGVLLENWQVKEGVLHCEGYNVFNIQQLEGDHQKLKERLQYYQQEPSLENAFNATNLFLKAHGRDMLSVDDAGVKDYQAAVGVAIKARTEEMYPNQDVSLSSAIATSFVLQKLGLPQPKPWETEKSTAKNWADSIQQDKAELFRSIRDSSTIVSDVMLTYNKEADLSNLTLASEADRLLVGQRDLEAVIKFAAPSTPNGKVDILQSYIMDRSAFVQNLPQLYGKIEDTIYDVKNESYLNYIIEKNGVTIQKAIEGENIVSEATFIGWDDFSKQVEESIVQGNFVTQEQDKDFSKKKSAQSSEVNESASPDLKEAQLRQKADKKIADATRAEQLTQGARQMPRGNDANLTATNLSGTQETIVTAVNKSANEIAELRSDAAALKQEAGKSAIMTAILEANAYFEEAGIENPSISGANDGQEYFGKVIGVTEGIEGQSGYAIQLISDNQAVLHQVKEMSRFESLLSNEERAIISKAGVMHSVTSMKQALADRELEEENSREQDS